MEVGRIVDIEDKRKLYHRGKLKASALTGAEWAAIERHDELYEQHEAERDEWRMQMSAL